MSTLPFYIAQGLESLSALNVAAGDILKQRARQKTPVGTVQALIIQETVLSKDKRIRESVRTTSVRAMHYRRKAGVTCGSKE